MGALLWTPEAHLLFNHPTLILWNHNTLMMVIDPKSWNDPTSVSLGQPRQRKL